MPRPPPKMRLVIVILIQIHMLQTTVAAGSSMCNTDSDDTDQTCPSNCSQNYERIPGYSYYFNCSIGGIDSIKMFNASHRHYFLPDARQLFDAPILQDIFFYKKAYPDKKTRNPALSINFLLPKGVKPTSAYAKFPEAVLLKFESIADEGYQDYFYYHCPRHRIFQFHSYAPPNTYDLYHPRNLTFDCLVGLNQSNKGQLRVYLITLQTVQGRKVIYTVMVNVFTGELKEDNAASRQLVVATASNLETRSIYVVIQKVPKILFYIVQLVRVGQTDPVVEKKLPKENNTVTFTQLEPGRYVVKVGVKSMNICEEFPCMNSTSYVVHIPGHADSVHYADPGENAMKVVAMVTGCTVGASFVLLLFWIILKKRKKEKTTVHGYLLHPYKQEIAKIKVVDSLSEYLQAACNCTLEKLPEDLNEITPENTLKERYEATLGKRAKFVVVVMDKNAVYPDSTIWIERFYSYAVSKAVEQKKQNNVRIFPVDYLFSTFQVPEIMKNIHSYHLMPALSELVEEIKKLSDVSPENHSDILGKHAALKSAVNSLAEQNIRGPPLPSIPVPIPKMENDELNVHKPNNKNGIEMFRDMALGLNASRESLDGSDRLGKAFVTKEYPSLFKDNGTDSTTPLLSSFRSKDKDALCHNTDKMTNKGAAGFPINGDAESSASPLMGKSAAHQHPTNSDYRKLPRNRYPAGIPNSDTELEMQNMSNDIVQHGTKIKQCTDKKHRQNTDGYVSPELAEKYLHQPSRKPEMPKQPAMPDANDYVDENFVQPYPGQAGNYSMKPHSYRHDVWPPGHDATGGHPATRPKILHEAMENFGEYVPGFHVKHSDIHIDQYSSHDRQEDRPHYVGKENRKYDPPTDYVPHGFREDGQDYGGGNDRRHCKAKHGRDNRQHDDHVPYVTKSFLMHPRVHDNCQNDHVTESVLMNPGVHNNCQNALIAGNRHHNELEQGPQCNRPGMLQNDYDQRTAHARLGGLVEIGNNTGAYVRHANPGPCAHGHNPGHQPYVGHADLDEAGRLIPSHGFSGLDTRQDGRYDGFHGFPKPGHHLRHYPAEADHQHYVTDCVALPANYPRCDPQNDNNGDSLLPADSSLEYETSMGTNPSSYETYDQINMEQFGGGGYVPHNLERNRPIGCSDNAITSAKLSFEAVDPTTLEKSLTKEETREDNSSKPKRSRTPPALGFTAAMKAEGQLKEEFDSFQPIPPEDDSTPDGSLNDVMENITKFNSR